MLVTRNTGIMLRGDAGGCLMRLRIAEAFPHDPKHPCIRELHINHTISIPTSARDPLRRGAMRPYEPRASLTGRKDWINERTNESVVCRIHQHLRFDPNRCRRGSGARRWTD